MIAQSVDRATGRADVILDRPAKLNAMTVAMWHDLATVVEALSADDALRVVVISGAGRAFSAGADIGEFERTRGGKAQAIGYARTVHRAVAAIQACPHPTVAAIRGQCVGGGVEIAASCDIRIATGDSRFGVPIKRLGLTVDYPELAALCRLVGPANALEILLEGRIFGAAEALEKGLINRLVAPEAFDEEIDAAAARIAEGAPLVARWHKRMVRRLEAETDIPEDERRAPLAVFDSEDYRIGTRAFLDKRAPEFVGR